MKTKTDTNLHPYERVFRVIIGILLISMAFFGPENLWFLTKAGQLSW